MFIVKFIAMIFKFLGLVHPRWAGRLAVELLFRPLPTKRTAEENLFWARGLPITFESGCRGRIFKPMDASCAGTIAIVHGWQSQGVRFKKIIQLALAHRYQVVVWNGPAHGESPGRRTHLAEFTRTLVKDLSALSFRYDVVLGYSFGAAAVAYAAHLGLEVKNLVLLAGPSSARRVFERYFGLIKLGPPARQIFMDQVEMEARLKTDELSSENFIAQIRQSVLVIHDENDKIVPYEDALRLKEIRPDIDLFSTQKLGHFRILNSEPILTKLNLYFTSISSEFRKQSDLAALFKFE